MQMNQPPPTPYYGIQLLDDLHHYFPAVLYDPSRFNSVQDLLEYIRDQTRNRFDLFSRAANIHGPQIPLGAPAPTNPVRPASTVRPRLVRRRSPSPPGATGGTGETVSQPITPVSIRFTTRTTTTERGPTGGRHAEAPAAINSESPLSQNIIEENELPFAINNLIRSSLVHDPLHAVNVPLGGLGSLVTEILGMTLPFHETQMNPHFMDPVTVAPSREQIERATDLRGATVQEEASNCSICQENFAHGQAVLEIRHCKHLFHRACLEPWFQSNTHCPMCRYDIREED